MKEYPFTKDQYSEGKFISLGVSNFYGETEVGELNGTFYILLSCWNGISYKEISKEFYEACEKEFGR